MRARLVYILKKLSTSNPKVYNRVIHAFENFDKDVSRVDNKYYTKYQEIVRPLEKESSVYELRDMSVIRKALKDYFSDLEYTVSTYITKNDLNKHKTNIDRIIYAELSKVNGSISVRQINNIVKNELKDSFAIITVGYLISDPGNKLKVSALSSTIKSSFPGIKALTISYDLLNSDRSIHTIASDFSNNLILIPEAKYARSSNYLNFVLPYIKNITGENPQRISFIRDLTDYFIFGHAWPLSGIFKLLSNSDFDKSGLRGKSPIVQSTTAVDIKNKVDKINKLLDDITIKHGNIVGGKTQRNIELTRKANSLLLNYSISSSTPTNPIRIDSSSLLNDNYVPLLDNLIHTLIRIYSSSGIQSNYSNIFSDWENIISHISGSIGELGGSPSYFDILNNRFDNIFKTGKDILNSVKIVSKATISNSFKQLKNIVLNSKHVSKPKKQKIVSKIPTKKPKVKTKIISISSSSSSKPTRSLETKHRIKDIINSLLHDTLQKNMTGEPTLKYRTGRFARSAKVLDVTQRGNQHGTNLTVDYGYQTDPYQVFESTMPWAKYPQRNPQYIIDNAIKDIVRERFTKQFKSVQTRFYGST
jgi:hypothetical protein